MAFADLESAPVGLKVQERRPDDRFYEGPGQTDLPLQVRGDDLMEEFVERRRIPPAVHVRPAQARGARAQYRAKNAPTRDPHIPRPVAVHPDVRKTEQALHPFPIALHFMEISPPQPPLPLEI